MAQSLKMTGTIAGSILDIAAGLELRTPVVWLDRPQSVRAEMVLHNTPGLPVKLGMTIQRDVPGKPTMYLMLWGVQVRRLDVNGSHTNRVPPRERWRWRTHKHVWTEANGDSEAYTPDDIPELGKEQVPTGKQYQELFEAFCAECRVALGSAYRWNDPVLGTSRGNLFLGGAV